MIIELLTPLAIATSPVIIPNLDEKASYSHLEQAAKIPDASKSYQVAFNTATYGGTQTFDMNGRPHDSDADQDQS